VGGIKKGDGKAARLMGRTESSSGAALPEANQKGKENLLVE